MKCQKSNIFDRVGKKLNFFQTKGQGLPITTIVIAALAILVLVILFAITTGKLAIFSGAVSECPGECLTGLTEQVLTNDYDQAIKAGILTTIAKKSACVDNYQKQIQGKYIAQGIRGKADSKKEGQPITCKICCAALA